MEQTNILLLLLLLWDNVELTLTNQVCSQLPTFEHASVSDEYKKEQYQNGDVIYFACDPGYTTGFNVSYICTEGGWRATTYGQCIEEGTFPLLLGCLPPTLKNGHLLHFNYFYADGDTAKFQCDPRYKMTGRPFKTCSNGQWTGDVLCQDSCDVVDVSHTVLVSPRNVRQLQSGQSLQFRCRDGSHVLHGAQQVTCLEDGRWSQPFPSCTDPRSCGSPPTLENGDFLASSIQFEHNTRVLYQCQAMYMIEGGPYKTCINGVWTGEITCLKPCTVNQVLMEPNKIQHRWRYSDKLYAPHNDFLTFQCVAGATHDGAVSMRQRCINGEMTLPRCV